MKGKIFTWAQLKCSSTKHESHFLDVPNPRSAVSGGSPFSLAGGSEISETMEQTSLWTTQILVSENKRQKRHMKPESVKHKTAVCADHFPRSSFSSSSIFGLPFRSNVEHPDINNPSIRYNYLYVARFKAMHEICYNLKKINLACKFSHISQRLHKALLSRIISLLKTVWPYKPTYFVAQYRTYNVKYLLDILRVVAHHRDIDMQ